MDKIDVLYKIREEAIIAVIRAENKEQGLKVSEAVYKGGIKFLEVTMTVPGALEIVRSLSEQYQNEDVVIGVGTVLDPETARAAILAGAQFIVCPNVSQEVIRLANRYRITVIPGAMTISEAIRGLEFGADIVKVFPGGAFGPGIIKDFMGPVPFGQFMPSGGVSIENASEWIANGAIALGTGSSLTKGAKTDDYEIITRTAVEFVAEVRAATARRIN